MIYLYWVNNMQLILNNEKIEIKYAKKFIDRLMGLMGKKSITYGMLFPKCNSVHTFFMKDNIDILGLDKNNQVIYIYRNCPKNRIVKASLDYKNTSILELPKNTSKEISIGSILKFQ